MTANRIVFLLGVMKMFQNWIMVMTAQLCECTKNDQLVHVEEEIVSQQSY